MLRVPTASRVYLDFNATAPLRSEARAAMQRALCLDCGNPSSGHAPGRAAHGAIERARGQVAALVGVAPDEIVFTSGGTEGNHLGIRGLAAIARRAGRGAHVVSSQVEHPSVAGALAALRADGFEVTLLPVDAWGRISIDDLRRALRPNTALVTLATVNNETGNIYPVGAMAAVAHERGALFHTDAVQAAGKIPVDLHASGVDAATVSGHKVGGPPGVGAVFVRHGLDLPALMSGGHQEHGCRAGTENVIGIVGFGAAAEASGRVVRLDAVRIANLRDRLQSIVLAIPGSRLHGEPTGRAPGTLNVGFHGVRGDVVAAALDREGISVSTGAACSAGIVSPVMLAMGMSPDQAREAVRFSLGYTTTALDVARAAAAVERVIRCARFSPALGESSSPAGALVAGAIAVGVLAALFAAGKSHDRQWRSERGLPRDY